MLTTGVIMATFLKVNGSTVLTRDYTTGLIFQKIHKQGTGGIITRIRSGWFSTQVDIRLKDGTFLRRVPHSYFQV
jgi:hypothetical protein